MVGAGEMLASEQSPLPVVDQVGIRGLAGYLTPAFMLLCGVLLWLTSIARTYHALLAMLLALDSWLTANLGGFFIGMLMGVIGGALAFGWMRDSDYGSAEPEALTRYALHARSVVTAMVGALRELSAAGLRRLAGRPAKGPVQEALFELPSDIGSDEPAAPRWSGFPVARWCRQLNR
jgi:Family of unknown function (DUF6114)